ncbi:MAG: DUF2330 domain-containing protein [Pseudomonadota bacterium]|nr:DUF2330 domain-containing protein [Pseudomonadota bacterium]
MVLSLLTSAIPMASAFCGTYVGQAGADLYNHASQVALVRQGNHSTLSLAMDYEGPLDQFAIVIPVPVVLGPDDVRLLDADLFGTLDAYSGPRLVSYECADFDDEYEGRVGCGCGGAAKDGEESDSGSALDGDASVVVESAFTEGEYEIVVLSAEESSGLYEWLDANGYALPAGGEAILDEYIAAGSYFFAAKVSLPTLADGAVAGLSPLQFSYQSEVFSLPVRIGTISSDGDQDVIIYGITTTAEGAVGISNYPEVEVENECMWADEGEGFGAFYTSQFADAQATEPRPGWVTEYSWSSAGCDPCSGNPPDETQLRALGFTSDPYDMHFTRLHLRYGPNDVDQDLSLYASGIATNEQIRYITYKSDLEDQYPICGEGMAVDPGTCDDGEAVDVTRTGCGAPVVPLAALAAAAAALVIRRRQDRR